MKFLILIFSIFILHASKVGAATSTFCSLETKLVSGDRVYNFENVKCLDNNDCWLQFKAPEDLVKIVFNDSSMIDLSGEKNYLSNEFLLLPIYNNILKNKIAIHAQDINQDIKYPERLCLKIGKHHDLRWINSLSWFKSTGISLFSVYCLLIMSFFLLISLTVRRSRLGGALLAYSLVSSVYLISFSEYPRAFLDPVLSTGGYHFPLRLLQDFCLIFVFYSFYQKYDSFNFIKKISYVYLTVIGIYLLLLAVGVRDYIYFSRIIIIMAPLVAMPMAIGTWFAFKLENSLERKVLVPVSVLLFILQMNDLFVFWRIFDSYFTVKFYIPFIVGMTMLLYLKRIHDEVLESTSAREKQRIMKEFIHDVKSPIAVLRIFNKEHQIDIERQQIVQTALDRIEGMMMNLESPDNDDIQKVEIVSSIHEIIEQKKIEYPDLSIHFSHGGKDIYSFMNKNQIQRIISNLINNSYESYESKMDLKVVSINLLVGNDEMRMIISDQGKGISKSVVEKIFKSNISTKKSGSGLGLMSAYNYMKRIGGDINLNSKEGVGTSVEIKMNTVLGDVGSMLYSQKAISSSSELFDYILIDDDKYIRMSWEYFATNSMKKIRTFADVESFIEVSEFINKDCIIYLDLNIKGQKSTKYIEGIYQLGFTNIRIATGEEVLPGTISSLVQSVSGKLPPVH